VALIIGDQMNPKKVNERGKNCQQILEEKYPSYFYFIFSNEDRDPSPNSSN
jgi:hypothetical protein